ncbi:MAG TPA: MFS transporter [Rhodospirillales bacterium]|nr:MFS transporter [Rhodospirillales bacterium]
MPWVMQRLWTTPARPNAPSRGRSGAGAEDRDGARARTPMTTKAAEKSCWGAVVVAVVAGMIAASHLGKLPPSLPMLRAELGLDLVFGGWVVSVFGATGAALGLAAGSLADRIGHRRLTMIGLGLLAAGSAGGGLADAGVTLLASRFVEGFGFLSIAVAAPSLIATAVKRRDRRLALGIWSAYMPASITLVLLGAPALLSTAGWRGIWWALAGVSVLWIGVVALAAPAPRSADSRPPASLVHNVRLTIGQPGPWLLAVCFPLYTLQWMALMVWLPTFLVEERAMGLAAAAALSALVVAVNVPGNIVAGWLMRRGARHWILIAIGAAAMGASALGIFSPALSDGLRYGLCLAFSGLGGFLPAAVLSGAPVFSPSPDQLGMTNGLLMQGSNLGQFVGPPALAAVVTASGSWNSVAWLMCGAATAAVVLAGFVRVIENRLALARA